MKDNYGRNIDYIRISVTDRCNLRCAYCMPRKAEFLPAEEILSFEDILKVCRAASELGISKIKITGGEPLLRKGVINLIKSLKSEAGIRSVTLTTNGILAEDFAEEIYKAGADSVNISLDTLNRETYYKITGRDCLDKVLRGINALESYGIKVKINTVLQKNVNHMEFYDIISLSMDKDIDVRFIEMMPIGEGKDFEPVLNDFIINALGDKLKYIPLKGNGPAVYYSVDGYKGKIGFISPISKGFCHECSRIRLTSTGFLKGCLCYDKGIALKEILKENDSGKLKSAIEGVIKEKPSGHSFDNRDKITEKKGMNKIGG